MYQIRWSETERERKISYKRFYLALQFIVEAFEVINDSHIERGASGEFNEINIKGWDAKDEATQFLNSLTKFELVIGMIARLPHPVAGITLKL